MKQLLLLVSLILLGTIAIRDSYKEQPSLADPNNPLSLTCPEYLPAEHNINANPNFAKPVTGLNNVDQNWYAAALENITKEEYNISYSDELETYQSPNRANNMRFTYHKDGFTAQPRETKIPLFDLNDRKLRDDEKNYKEIEDWSIELKMESGKWKIENGKLKVESGKWKMENGKLKMENEEWIVENGKRRMENGKRRMENGKLKMESGEWKVDCSEMRIANAGSPPSGGDRGGVFEDNSLEVAANKAWIEDDNIRIDYTNTKQGMRQDFIIKNKPEKDGNLQIVMNAVTDLEMDVSNDEVRFSSAAGEKMQYASLKAWDAAGKTLDVYFEKRDESHFAIVVDDRDAEYPVTVDPLSSTPDWWHAGDQPNSYFGNCAAAGDVNGDGFDDVIISAEGYDNGQTDEGRVFAFYGSSAGLPGAANWSAEIDQEGADFGTSIASAGDVNGDGFSDVLIGAVYYDNGQVNEGGAFVYYGSSAGLSAVPNWTVESNQSGSWFGSVESAGDVNGDGFSDIIIGARHFDGTGKTFAYYGSATGLSAEPNWTAVSDQPGSIFGAVVSSAGDVNSDGYSDVIVGAPFYSNGESMEGKCFVYLGSASGLAAGYSWTSESNQHGAWFGWHVANAGDVNGDGYDDVLIGAVYYDNGENNEGAAFVYYGSASGLSTTPNWIAEGNQSDCEFGTIISTAGDVNADGYSDILITAPSYDNDQINEGRVYVYKGSSEGIESNPCWTSDGNQQNCLYGHVSYTAGDVNGDGYSDIIIGATGYDNGRGRAFIFYGSPEQITLTPDFIVSCDQDFARFGFSVSGAGDVNGDGFDDVIIGAPTYQIDNNEVGKVFAYYGSQNGLGTYPSWSFCLNFGYSLGWSVSGAGDVNGDGYSDVVFSKLYYGVFVFNGSQNGLGDLPEWSITNSPLNGIGYSVSSAGDVNNDGFSDIIIGSFNGYSYFGQIVCAHVFCGSQIGLPIDHIPSWTASLTFLEDGFGRTVASAGDVNGDGNDDVAVSGGDADGSSRVRVFYGSPSRTMYAPPDWTGSFGAFSLTGPGDLNGDGFGDLVASNLSGSSGITFAVYGSAQGLHTNPDWISGDIGRDAGIGDFNADGYSDLVGIVNYPLRGANLYFGSPGGLQQIHERYLILPEWGFHSIACAGDINGDSVDDVIGGTQIVSSYIYYGTGRISSSISLSPRNSHLLRNSELCLRAIVRDQNGQVLGNREVELIVKGANPDTSYSVTASDGSVQFCYIGINSGTDTIIAKSGNVTDQVTAHWDYPAPIELVSFSLSIVERNITLSWSTSSELNNSGFEIQRAIENGKLKMENGEWDKIGFVSGGGTTNEVREYSFTDRNLETGQYKYRLKQFDFNGNFEYFELTEVVSIGIPDKYDLSQNYPNPFNPVTTINYDLPSDGIVTIKVYDILGREVKTLVNEMKTAGYHKIQFNAADLASGAYFYQMKAGDFVAVKKFVVVK